MKNRLYKSECLSFRTRRADRILTQLYDSFIKPTGLKSTQYSLLRCINNMDEPSLSDIGATLCMDQTTVSRNVNKLLKSGYLSAPSSRIDPRRLAVCLTPFGQAKLKQAEHAWAKAQGLLKSRLGEEDFNLLADLLDRVADAIQYES